MPELPFSKEILPEKSSNCHSVAVTGRDCYLISFLSVNLIMLEGINVSIKPIIVSTEYGKEGNMPQSDILNSTLKMYIILHHSKIFPFGSVIFKFQGKTLCWENCVLC